MNEQPPSNEAGIAGTPTRVTPRRRFRTRMTAGLILVVPIWITLLLIGFVFGLMRDASLWIVEGMLTSPTVAALLERLGMSADALHRGGIETLPAAVRWGLAALSVLLTLCVIYLLGMVTTNIAGRQIVQAVESLVDRLPFVKTIYRASKQVLESFAGESAQSFKRVVLVPFPSANARSIGFITRVTKHPVSGEEWCAVFVATAPNPTTGYVLVVRRSELVDVQWTVEEAVKVIISGGVLLADVPPALEAAAPSAPASSVSP